MLALLVFIMATLRLFLAKKTLLDAKGPFGDYVSKIRLDVY